MSEVRDHGEVVQTVPLTKSALSHDEDLQYALKTARSISKWLYKYSEKNDKENPLDQNNLITSGKLRNNIQKSY